jgi:hypothetical protein
MYSDQGKQPDQTKNNNYHSKSSEKKQGKINRKESG